MIVTNEQLGAVYLEVDGLDKERFKELIKGMVVFGKDIETQLNDGYRFIENWRKMSGEWHWISTDSLYINARKITIDELEQLLKPVTTLQPTHFAISPEDYAEFMKWKDSQRPKLKPIELVKLLMKDCSNLDDYHRFPLELYYNYELVIKGYGKFDIIKAKCRYDGIEEDELFIGHWNDGVTE